MHVVKWFPFFCTCSYLLPTILPPYRLFRLTEEAKPPRGEVRGILIMDGETAPLEHGLKQEPIGTALQDQAFVPYGASMLHLVKSISWPHPWHTCLLSNSSENISFSFPQLGHLQINALRFFKSSNPGQCRGVVIIASRLICLLRPLMSDLSSIVMGHLHTIFQGSRFQSEWTTHHIHSRIISPGDIDAIV